MGENSLDHDGYSAKREMRRPEGIYTVRLVGRFMLRLPPLLCVTPVLLRVLFV